MAVAEKILEPSSSWERCRAAGLSRELTQPRRIQSSAEIAEYRRLSPLTAITTPVKQALDRATNHDYVLILTDPAGHVLQRFGTYAARHAAGQIGFIEGADWSELSVGTNAISEALRLEGPAYVSGESHYAYSHAYWTCMAAPIHCPRTGSLLGVLNISGPRTQVEDDVVGMVRSTALLAQEMLRLTGETADEHNTVRLRLMGAQPAIRTPATGWIKLSLRMAEILALLCSRSRGYSAEELAAELYGDDGRPATVRAEMHRIRRRLGTYISSDPYRFADGVEVTADIHAVQDALVRRDVDALLQCYTQPVLPYSTVECLTQWRAKLDATANELIANYASATQQAHWAQAEMSWEAAATTLQPSGNYSSAT